MYIQNKTLILDRSAQNITDTNKPKKSYIYNESPDGSSGEIHKRTNAA